MAEVIAVVREHRRRLIARERETTRAMVREWSGLRDLIEREQTSLAARMQRAVDAGDVIRPTWLHTEGRLGELAAQVAGEVERFTRRAVPLIGGHIVDAAELGVGSAGAGAGAAGVSGEAIIAATLQPRPVERLVAVTQRGAPVQRVLASMGEDAAVLLRQELLRGAALGENPLRVASRMRQVADVPLSRARTIARTEAMRAFRGGSLDTLRRIPDVEGWVWVAAADACVACAVMHGEVFPMSEELESHPNCRCVPAPQVPGQTVVEETGEQRIRAMDEGELTSLVGPEKAAALRGGRIVPRDLVGERLSPVWGRTRGPATLSRALTNAATRRAATL